MCRSDDTEGKTMDETRRNLILAGAAAAGAQVLQPAWAGDRTGEDLSVPARPQNPSPGIPGQFDFLQGQWKIHNRRLRGTSDEWEEFDGEATCWSILGGVVSIEELRIPSRNFSGMGLRTLDVGKQQWSDHWVNAASGVVSGAGMLGSFENGEALFYSEERDGDATVLVASLWDQIEARHCRWRQAVSRDGGLRWSHNWIMHWRKA
jgi:hypothetical protein